MTQLITNIFDRMDPITYLIYGIGIFEGYKVFDPGNSTYQDSWRDALLRVRGRPGGRPSKSGILRGAGG